MLVIYWTQFGGNCCILIVLDMRETYTRYITIANAMFCSFKDLFYFFEKVLLFLWSSTVRPYLNILDEWITDGILRDSYAETCIKMLVVNTIKWTDGKCNILCVHHTLVWTMSPVHIGCGQTRLRYERLKLITPNWCHSS